MITKVEIQNFKSFFDVSVELRKFNVLIGPNNSGKSNFCSVFKLLKNLTIMTGDEAFKGVSSLSQIIPKRGLTTQIFLSALSSGKGYEYNLRTEYSVGNLPVFQYENLIVDNNERILRKGSQLIKDPKVDFSLSHSILKKQPFNNEFHSFLDEIESFAYFRFFPSAVHKPAYIPIGSPPQIDESGFGLPAVLSHILHKNREAYSKIVEKMKLKFTDLIDINPEETWIIEKKLDEEKKTFENVNNQGYRLLFKIKEIVYPLESANMSDGISYFLLFLTLMNLPNKPKMFIIEEPENGIHPLNLKEIIGYLKQLSDENDCQVIITTHSPYLLDYVDIEDVLVFNRKEQGPTQIMRMSDIPDIKEKLKYYMLGEYWTEKTEKEIFEEIENVKS